MTTHDNLYKHLNEAYWHTRTVIAEEMKRLEEKPLAGWSIEKHKAYHEKAIEEAQQAQKWLFLQLMKINPD